MTGLDEALLGFAEELRGRGLVLPTDRVVVMLQAVGLVDLLDRDQIAAATRATCCSSPEDVVLHDAAFDHWFASQRWAVVPPRPVEVEVPDERGGGESGPAEPGPPREAPHHGERLRSRSLRDVDEAERDEALRLLSALRLARPERRVRRHQRGGRRIDPAATTRALLRTGGELPVLKFHEPGVRPRRVVALVDVSGSMRPWLEANLRFGYALRQSHQAEVFTLATRLTRVTAELSHGDVERAVRAAGAQVPDWTGGTRLADGITQLLDGWGRRGPLRGAVFVLVSDGLESGDPAGFGRAMARVSRLAHKVVWVHPRAGVEGWQPATRALVAALPWLDALVAGDSVEELEEAGRVIADPVRGPGRWQASA